uniref:Uncharacterized protein n=1 Tax=Arundo donax TaxID=35708 RepID=A0A0A9ES27_ARUDO
MHTTYTFQGRPYLPLRPQLSAPGDGISP